MRKVTSRIDAVVIQALIAASLSFAHLHDIAAAAGQDGWKAWAYPISVDLLLVVAWRRLRSGRAKAAGWCWFLIALAASLGANVATAGLLDLTARDGTVDTPDWLRILVAGWPAVAFFGGTLLAHTRPAPDPVAAPVEDPIEQPPAPAPVAAAEPALSLPPAQEIPTHAAAVPAVSAPPVLVEHARKIAAEHRARTGTPIDTATLRSRLGVAPALADAIALQLT